MEFFALPPASRQSLQTNLADVPWPSVDAATPTDLLRRCPAAAPTPLLTSSALADRAQIASLSIKDERARMGLGSFKALGAAYVIAHDAQMGPVSGRTYVTASAGNHGLSVAAGAAAFGAKAVIFLSETVPSSFAERLRALGAEVRRHGARYEDSMAGAADAAAQHGWSLLSDSSWPGYVDRPHRLMEGYTVLMQEVIDAIPRTPTHVFLQAGVGGLAAASAAMARMAWGTIPRIIVVEPDAAPALYASARAGAAQVTTGPASAMGRLDCKEPSLIALKGLGRDADGFMLITEKEGADGANACLDAGLGSTASGAAGIAGLLAAASGHRDALGLTRTSRILAILSEGPEA